METIYIQTPIGISKISGDKNGLTEILFGYENEEITSQIPICLKSAVKQLQEYFDLKRNTFDLKFQLNGTNFQQKVWNELQKIPFGKSISYLELSKKLGDAKAIRAVANANGKNPLSIVIPCHRVIGSDGSLTGYSGGLHRKKWLLDLENPVKQTSLF
jgi:methylated-DNA-[protein]-cysteine S-methyltransferase